MADEFADIKDMRERFLRAVYDLRQPGAGMAERAAIMLELGLDPNPTDPSDVRDRNLFNELAGHWRERGYIEPIGVGYAYIKITADGIRHVEEGPLQPASGVTFNVGNAYGSIFGTQQHAQMNNVSFDFSTVESVLDRAEEDVERRGGRDAAELKELIAEVRALHESGGPVDKGRLAKYLEVIQRNGWIASPIAGTLLSSAVGA
jgi:hypothetical protein